MRRSLVETNTRRCLIGVWNAEERKGLQNCLLMPRRQDFLLGGDERSGWVVRLPIGKLGVPITERLAIAVPGQERSPQPVPQKALFRLRPAANDR